MKFERGSRIGVWRRSRTQKAHLRLRRYFSGVVPAFADVDLVFQDSYGVAGTAFAVRGCDLGAFSEGDLGAFSEGDLEGFSEGDLEGFSEGDLGAFSKGDLGAFSEGNRGTHGRRNLGH